MPSGGNCTGTAYDTPSWSRDGNRIVLDTGERLAVMNADGSGLTLLPATTADDGNPAFAPRGERIVYAGTNERGTTDLYVRRLDGGEPELIVHDADEPAWSIGNVLAYARSATSTSHDRAGATVASSPQASRPTGRLAAAGLRSCVRCRALSLTRPPGASTPSPRRLRRVGRARLASHPVWSPDGRWIAFDGFDLGVMAKRRGSRSPAREVAPTQISGESGSVVSSDPAWRPLR